ncbi:hypothetical protein [Terrabacter sp. MAHUQ-38]|uniref:hypothetical protein n=1 Tax=unclassified Terrabacter TaxID=2630222 RepID=UPI00165E6DB4|nr:hypothetical protein [Terrabacter sp. MAHUQ-38]MBC9820514.1 hypothetical protein [Terrabacter sp. MAHUQ-38]
MAAVSVTPLERELHLIDVENLIGTPYFTAAAVRALRSAYNCVSQAATGALQVIGTSAASNVLIAALAWGSARPVFENGPDGADRALLAAGEFAPERRFGRIVIGSGDHVFAFYAADLQSKGVEVTVVCRPEALSRKLLLAVNDVRYLPHIDSGPTAPASHGALGRVA